MKRAIRRHHYYRLKNQRTKMFQCYYGWALSAKFSGMYANTPCVCSCWMCGNPRKKFKVVTRQEYKTNMKLVEDCQEENIYYPYSLRQLGKFKY